MGFHRDRSLRSRLMSPRVRLRKTLWIGFAIAASVLCAACASKTGPKEMESGAKTVPTVRPADDATATVPSAVKTEGKATLIPEITYTFGMRQLPKDLAMVEDAINDILIPAIHVQLELDPIEDGVYNEKMQLRMAAREHCDIVFTSNWTNDFYLNVINGSLCPLEDLLPEYAPGLWASIPSEVWEAVRIQGHIYAVINQQMWPRAWGVHVNKEYADKYGLDLKNVHRFEDLESFAQALLEGEGGKVTPYCKPAVPFYGQYNGVFGFGSGVVIPYDDPTAVNLFKLPQWQKIARLNRRWLQAG